MFLMKIAYDGSSFAGWQRLPDKRTVQGTIENALSKMLNEAIQIDGAGRTDAGVHALGQFASFNTTRKISLKQLEGAINNFLPEDVQMLALYERDENFHARYSAKGKVYGYKIKVDERLTPFESRYIAYHKKSLDEVAIRQAMKAFVGQHDFKTFMASGSSIQNTIRTIKRFDLKIDGAYWYFEIEGDGFLYNMVRIIIGSLLDIGEGKISAGKIPEILESYDRSKAKRTAPSCGLYLVDVRYDDESLKAPKIEPFI